MTSKEEKRQKKEEKQAAAKRNEKRNSLLMKAAIALFVPLALFVFYQGIFTGPPSLPPDIIGDADHVRGAQDSDVTITVYADFQCPACLNETQVIARAWPRISEDVRVVYRNFPLDTHRFSFEAARYAEAAGMQDNFWPMHDLLFANQLSWSGVEDPTLFFEGYAEELELDLEQLRADIELPEVRAKINADQQSGIRAGVRSTPSMYINGEMVSNPQTAGGLIDLIEEARASI
ncbi:MAG: thioredoxin domain-containing protein [Gammaproteobacteria bacterium]|nr:thioredoxin domain-containing protein [Gammaproteobacteria bacterium]